MTPPRRTCRYRGPSGPSRAQVTDENLLQLWRYNGSWNLENGTPDLTNNRFEQGYSDPWYAGVYALLEAESYIIPEIEHPLNTSYASCFIPLNVTCYGP